MFFLYFTLLSVFIFMIDLLMSLLILCVYVIVFTVDLEGASNKPVPRKPLVLFVPRGSYTGCLRVCCICQGMKEDRAAGMYHFKWVRWTWTQQIFVSNGFKAAEQKGITCLCRGLFKVWSILKKKRLGHHSSVYWLLQEPVVCGTHFIPGYQVGSTMQSC